MSDELPELPENWLWVKTGDICDGVVPGRTKPKDFDGTIPWITLPDITGLYVSRSQNNLAVTKEGSEEVGMKIMPKGTVLMSCVGQFGAICIAENDIVPNQQFHGFVCLGKIVPEFVAYALTTQVDQMNQLASATTIAYINKTKCNSIQIPLAPLNEQRRIVAKIEELRDRHHRAKQALEAVPKLCDRFRQSVLAAAFRGDLTADWREQNPDVEPASVLLERIKERRFELAESKRDLLAIQKAYAEGMDSPVSGLSLPDGWLHCRINDIGNVCNGSTPSRKEPQFWDGSIPWVSSGEVRNNQIFQTREAITEKGYNSTSVRLLPINAVLLAMIGEGKTRGQTAILRLEATINQNIAAVILNHGLVLPEYLWYWFQYQYASTREAGSGSGPQALNCQRVREISFVLSPLEEQKAVVACIENMLKSLEMVRQQLQLTTGNLEYLNQSILAKAFRGELVEQDPNDEPASVLLDRLRAEREAQQSNKASRGKGTGRQRKKVIVDE